MSKPPVLITGARGLLAPYLAGAATGLGPVITTSGHGGDIICDLTDDEAVSRLVQQVRPSFVFHAAALTDVDACQNDPRRARELNVDIVRHLTKALERDTHLVFFSTDQVYPDTPGPHDECDVDPVNVYGNTKLKGEEAALAHGNTLIVRTNFFGKSLTPGRQSLSDFVIDALTAGRQVPFFADVLFSPLHASTLARVVVGAASEGRTGTYNAGSRNGCSKYDFAMQIASHLDLATTSAERGSSAAMPGRAPRPHDLRMRIGLLEDSLGLQLPSLDEEIARL